MRADDLPAVVRLAETLHPDFPERPDVFAERLALFPQGCLARQGEDGLAGYALSHPWAGPAPKLDTLLGRLPTRPDHLFLHDAALLPAARGAGAARALVDRLARLAQELGLAEARLAAVSGSAPIWARLGFVETGEPCPHSYGADARAMARPVP